MKYYLSSLIAAESIGPTSVSDSRECPVKYGVVYGTTYKEYFSGTKMIEMSFLRMGVDIRRMDGYSKNVML